MPLKKLVKNTLFGQVRHALTGVGAAFVAFGYMEQSMVEPFVGIVMYAGMAGWSAWEKRDS